MLSYLKSLQTEKELIQVFKYLVFGGFNAIFAYLVYALGIFLGLNYFFATLVSFVISVFTGFLMYKFLVFKQSQKKRNQLAYYYVFYGSLFALAILLHYIFNLLGFNNDYYNGFVVQGINIVIAFLVNKFIFFK